MVEGMSTVVYRIQTADMTYYLRVWPEPDESFAPEVTVHRHLRMAGVHVPDVVHYEHQNAVFQRSVMVTTAITGRAIGYAQHPPTVAAIVRRAGRELARINQMAVEGYGWIQRDGLIPDRLQAEYSTMAAWLVEHFDAPIRALHHYRAVAADHITQLLALLDAARQHFQDEPTVLAHGDFDVTHIYYHNDTYTGVIDFGEIRGTHQVYDLAHFAIENEVLLPYLLHGYAEVMPLSGDVMQHIQLTGLLIAARRIGRRVLQGREPHQPDLAFIAQMLPNFLHRYQR
jgi:aminoglycoside phosphotransferase (APT) family kinase protein